MKEALNGIKGIHERRLAFTKEVKRIIGDWDLVQNNPLYKNVKKHRRFKLKHMGRMERMKHMGHMKHIERLQSYSTDYQNIKIDEDSVIYCDIPYKNTNKYNNMDFDYERFYSWCERQTESLFISSYEMPEDRLVCIASFEHVAILSPTAKKKVIEKVFIPKHQAKDYKVPGLLF